MSKNRVNWRKEFEWTFGALGGPDIGVDPPSHGSQAFLEWARSETTAFFNLARPFLAKMATAEEVEALTDEGQDVQDMIDVCRRQQAEELALKELTDA